FQTASQKITTRKELLKKLEEKKLLEKNQQILKEHFERFKENKTKLEQHEKLSKYTPDLRDYDSIVKEIENSNHQIIALQKQKREEEIRQKTYLDSSSKLLGESLQISYANEQLEIFRRKIVDLQTEENAKKNEALL